MVSFQKRNPVGYDWLPHSPPTSQDFMNKDEKEEFESYSLQEAEMQMKLFWGTWQAEYIYIYYSLQNHPTYEDIEIKWAHFSNLIRLLSKASYNDLGCGACNISSNVAE